MSLRRGTVMAESASSKEVADERNSKGVWFWLLPALTFLVGAALAAGLFVLGDTDDADDVEQVTAGESPSPEPDASPTPDELVVQVPAVCVEAAELAASVSSALGDVVDAAGALDARRLQESLDVVQRMRPDVESASADCRELALEGRIVTPEVTADPSVSPTSAG